jgi:hypothetical protein
MPLVPFASLPDDARLWIFGARAPLDDVDAPRLLGAVDRFLKEWKAHGNPLTCGREFLEEYFLLVAVDERASDASGCSIDGLFRLLQQAEEGIGTSMVGGGNVYFRDQSGLVHCVSRGDFAVMGQDGDVTGDTPVFDTTLTTVGDFRARFERPARQSWHADLLPPQARK